LTIGLHAIEPGADAEALFAAANCEQDWQAELWGWDSQAEENRAQRLEAFRQAVRFAALVNDR
jgi:chaperone required for assembly of F1-ATPase